MSTEKTVSCGECFDRGIDCTDETGGVFEVFLKRNCTRTLCFESVLVNDASWLWIGG